MERGEKHRPFPLLGAVPFGLLVVLRQLQLPLVQGFQQGVLPAVPETAMFPVGAWEGVLQRVSEFLKQDLQRVVHCDSS